MLPFWEVAVEHGRAEVAASAMLQLIREELRRGALDAAVAQWWRVRERVPGALLEPSALLKLLPAIRNTLGGDAAVLALHQAVHPANRGCTPDLAAEIARAAVELEPEVAIEAANRGLEAKTIAPALAAELRELVAKLQAAEDDAGPRPVQAAEFEDDHDRSAFAAVDDLSADPEPAGAARVDAAPTAGPVAPRQSGALFPGAHIVQAALVEKLLERTRGVALPDEAAGRGRPLRIFDSVDANSAQVLRIGSA